MRTIFLSLGLATLISGAAMAPAAAAQSATGRPTLVSVALQINQETGEFSTLISLLTQYPDLVDALSAKQQLTVFAPTDAAFARLFAIVDPATLTAAQVKDILLYHVTEGRRSAGWLADRSSVTMLNGDQATVANGDGVTIDGAHVVIANVPASNGFIHAIDAVLLPPDLG
jgi:uncharacterized surface protein with fasciclin (FAS1) repeats